MYSHTNTKDYFNIQAYGVTGKFENGHYIGVKDWFTIEHHLFTENEMKKYFNKAKRKVKYEKCYEDLRVISIHEEVTTTIVEQIIKVS